MDKRTIIALLLILVVFWISSEFFWKNKKKAVTQNTPAETIEKRHSEPAESIPEETNENILKIDEYKIEPLDDDLEINENIILENDLMCITFSNKGGVITSIKLKEYTKENKIDLVELIPEEQTFLNIHLDSNGNSTSLENRIFSYSFQNDNTLLFYFDTNSGKVEKKFILADDYSVELELKIDDFQTGIDYQLDLDSGIADTEKFLKMKSTDYRIITQINNKIEKVKLAKLNKERVDLFGNIDWLAIRSKYFVLGIVPDKLISLNKAALLNRNNSPAAKLKIDADRTNIDHKYKLYFGPLIKDNLLNVSNGFEKIQEGPFIELLRPLSNFFSFIFSILYKVIPSFGIVIIIFAIILKMIMYPLTHKSFESTTKMQKIQPLMKEIQTKYKQDPRKMQVELKKLYKEHGASPLGGCLPILLQMPVFFSIYPVIRYSIELRQQGFLWLYDLSEPDSYWILPILMAVFMFVQQKLMSPTKQALDEMDEKQRATMQSQKMMMYIMPIVMFFIFKSLSSGLVLYWTVFSVMSSVQQYFIKKKFSG